MRPDPIIVELADQQYTIRPLNLRQVRMCSDALSDSTISEIDRLVRIIVAGLSRDHANYTADTVLDLEITPEQLSNAAVAILRIGGMVQPGKAMAPQPTSDTGSASTVA